MNYDILITGGSGMLGSVLMRGADGVIAPDDHRLNLARSASFELFKKRHKKIKTILHCAGITDVNLCEQEKELAYEVNVRGTERITNLARYYKAQLFYISTPMVFSGVDGNYTESSHPDPLNYYGVTKLLAEQIVKTYEKSLVLRANPIGVRPSGSEPSFIQWFVDAARTNRSFDLFTDVVTNPISTSTFRKIIFKMIDDFYPGILHLGSVDLANKAEIWDFIVKRFPEFSGKVNRVSVDQTKAGHIAKRPKQMWLNVDGAVKLGYILPNWKQEVTTVVDEILSSVSR